MLRLVQGLDYFFEWQAGIDHQLFNQASSYDCRVQCYKTFLRLSFTNVRNELECLSLGSVSSLVQCLGVKLESTLEWIP
jgi:hypothetical protein